MKKGFTLIEIILSIALITLVGVTTTVLVINNNKNKEIKILKQNSQKLENALNVYLDSHPEIITNLNANAKAAIVTLDTLKLEGLIKDNLEVDYKNEYFLLSNMKLLENSVSDKTCENDVIGIDMIKSWDLNKYDSSKVLYICPNDDSNQSNNINVAIEELQKRIEALESNTGSSINYFVGENVNNYVYFEVENSGTVIDYYSFPNDSKKNLWRIVSYSGNLANGGITGNIKLVYNKVLTENTNNSYMNLGYSTRYITNLVDQYNVLNGTNYKIDDFDGLENDSNIHYINSCNYNGNTVFLYKKKNQDIFELYYSTNVTKYGPKNLFKILDTINPMEIFNDSDFTCSVSNFNILDIKITDHVFGLYGLNSSIISDKGYIFKTTGTTGYDVMFQNPLIKLYDNITNKSWIDKYPYYVYSNTLSGSTTCNTNFSKSVYNYLGIINNEEYNNTKESIHKRTWLSYYANSNSSILNVVSTASGSTYTERGNVECGYAGVGYVPVITLKQGVKIIDNPNCTNDGSEACPYLLEYNEN